MKIIRSKRNRNGILAILAAGVLSTALVSLAQAAPKADNPGLPHRVSELESTSTDSQARIEALESANTDSQTRIEALESFVKLLHRQSAAVLEIDNAGSSAEFTELEFRLIFCSGVEYNGSSCPVSAPDLAVTLSESSEGTITTFSAASDSDFDEIVALLTNGESDFIESKRSPVGTVGGSTRSASELSFLRDFLAPGAVDLSGYSISRISLAVEVLSFTDNNPGGTSYRLFGRLFFELGE